jgi:hypothetical protein
MPATTITKVISVGGRVRNPNRVSWLLSTTSSFGARLTNIWQEERM